MKIAFFDSGIGGLTVLQSAMDIMPPAEYIYFADTQNVPYGIKPKGEVVSFVMEAAEFLSQYAIDALVVACNTATSVAIKELRAKYRFPIIGMEPAIKPAVLNNKSKNILVLATTLTLNESKLNSLIETVDVNQKIRKMEMDRLVGFAENFDFNSDAVYGYLREKLRGITIADFETIVLGCTHFIYFKGLIGRVVGPDISIVDGNIGTVKHLKCTLASANIPPLREATVSFYSSCSPDSEERVNKLMSLLTRDN